MKILLKFSIGIFALILIVVLGFAFTFNPNDYKQDIITLVKEKTGRQLSIPGEISLSFFPWIGLDLGQIEISNAKGFGKQPFAKMKHLQVRAKLWPLFKQQLEADTVVIDGLKLNLAKNQHGISNWDDLTQPAQSKAPPSTKKKTTKTNKNASDQPISPQNIVGALALNGLQLTDAQFNWHDKKSKQQLTVKDINLTVGKLKPETKIPFSAELHIIEKSLDAKIKFTTDMVFSSDLNNFSFHDTQLLTGIKLAALKPRLSPQISSSLMKFDLNKQVFSTNNLAISEGDIHLQAQLTVNTFLTKPNLNGQLTIDTFNPKLLANRFGVVLPATSDKNALTKINAQLNLKGDLSKLNLSNIKLTLDDSILSGHALYKPMPASSAVNLTIDSINVDRYLPEVATTSTNDKPSTKNPSAAEAALIPVALLNAYNVDADFKVGKIHIKKTYWTDFNFVAKSKNGSTLIKPLTMKGYDATVNSNFNIKTQNGSASLSGYLNIQKIKAGQILNDLNGKDKLKGTTSIVANFNTSGIKLSQLKQNLNGKLKLHLKDGTFKGFDLEHQRQVLDAKIKRKPEPPAPQPIETKIANLSASAVITNGLLRNKDLRASTPLARVIGSGTVDIAKEKINYTASVKFTSSTKINNALTFEKMKAIPLDIDIGGTFDKPTIKPNFNKVLKQLVKKEMDKQKKKVKSKIKKDIKKQEDKLKKDLQKKLGDKLKNLFKF